MIEDTRRLIVSDAKRRSCLAIRFERQNLAMRMSMCRFTRLTNGSSKKWENLNYILAIYFAYYNFCLSHKTLNDATPAMAANITNLSGRDLLHAVKEVSSPE